MRYTIQYLILGSMMLLHTVLSGQDSSIVPVDTTGTVTDSVSTLVSSADQAFHFFSEEGQAIDTLVGNVVLIQDSLYMTCDYAIVIDDIRAYARGNIRPYIVSLAGPWMSLKNLVVVMELFNSSIVNALVSSISFFSLT